MLFRSQTTLERVVVSGSCRVQELVHNRADLRMYEPGADACGAGTVSFFEWVGGFRTCARADDQETVKSSNEGRNMCKEG